MERNHDRRCSMDGGGAGEQRGQNPSCDRKRGRTT
jgi:hypothetical protein